MHGAWRDDPVTRHSGMLPPRAQPQGCDTSRVANAISSLGSSDRANGRRGSDIQGLATAVPTAPPGWGAVGCGSSVLKRGAHPRLRRKSVRDARCSASLR